MAINPDIYRTAELMGNFSISDRLSTLYTQGKLQQGSVWNNSNVYAVTRKSSVYGKHYGYTTPNRSTFALENIEDVQTNVRLLFFDESYYTYRDLYYTPIRGDVVENNELTYKNILQLRPITDCKYTDFCYKVVLLVVGPFGGRYVDYDTFLTSTDYSDELKENGADASGAFVFTVFLDTFTGNATNRSYQTGYNITPVVEHYTPNGAGIYMPFRVCSADGRLGSFYSNHYNLASGGYTFMNNTATQNDIRDQGGIFLSHIIDAGRMKYVWTPGAYLNKNLSEIPASTNYNEGGYNIWKPSGQEIELREYYGRDKIENMVSSLGVYWTGSDEAARTAVLGVNCTDNRVRLGKMYADGTTDGTYTRGADTAGEPQAAANSIYDLSPTPADPTQPGGGEDDSGTPSDRTGHSIGNTRRFNVGDCDGFITQYCMSAAQVSEMGGKIWEALALRDPANTGALLQSLGNLAVQFEESVAESAGLTVRPGDVMSNIIALREYPFNLADFVSYEEAGKNIFVGNGKAAVPLSSTIGKMTTYSERIDGGGGAIDVPRRFNDFRDYDAKYEIYVPFCGSAELPAENVVGTTLAMHYGIDFATGGMIAVCISIDGNGLRQPVAVLSGQVGANVPLAFSGQITAEKMLTSIAGGFNIISRAGRAIALQGVGGLVNPDLAYDAANLAAQASRPDPVYKISSGSDFSSLLAPDLAYLSITYGKYNIPENYAHTVGNAVNTTAQLGTLSGFTVCENVDVSGVPCSAEEAAEIKKYLESGVYL